MPSLLERPPGPPKRARRRRFSLLSEDEEVKSLQVGIVLTVVVWFLILWLFFIALKHLGHISNKTFPKEKPRFDIELTSDFAIPQKQPPPNKFVETNPDAPENMPDKTQNFAAHNQQVAQEKAAQENKSDKPQLEGKKDREVTQIVSGQLHKPEQQPPPQPPPQKAELLKKPAAKEARREQNPLPGEQNVKGEDAEGVGLNASKATDNIADVKEKVAGQKDAPSLTGDPQSAQPKIDPQRPQPRKHVDRNVRPAVLMENKVGTTNVGLTGIDARWSQYGEYLQRMIETIQVEWERINDAGHVYPPQGTEVTVKFRLEAKQGAVSEIIESKSSGGSQAERACISGITGRSPYGKWSEDMVAMLGDSQEMTFTFYYQ